MAIILIADIQSVSTTGPLVPTVGIDTSGLINIAFTIHLECAGLNQSKGASIAIEESTNAFVTASPIWIPQFFGLIGGKNSVRVSRSRYEFDKNLLLVGSAGAVMRCNVVAIDSGATVQLRAWLEV